VVAGDHDRLALPAQRAPDGAQDRCGGGHRPLGVAVHQLDGVTEENEPIDIRETLEQPVAGNALAQHVPAAAVAEVQIGDNQRAHGGAR
jgi:hypothetical protein